MENKYLGMSTASNKTLKDESVCKATRITGTLNEWYGKYTFI